MRALAFDQASKTGFAAWDGISPAPLTGRHTVALWGVDDGAMFERFRVWLGKMLDEHQPELIAAEAPAVGGHMDIATIYRQAMIYGALNWAAYLKQVPFYSIANGTWRKSFIGFGARGKRVNVDWKKLALARCRVLGWEVIDHNAAEAAGILDHVLFVERGILTPWRTNLQHWLPLPEIINVK